MEKSNETQKLDLKYLVESKILKKGQAVGNIYNDTKITDNLPNLQNLNDIYFLIIEKIVFSVGTYLGGSINGIDLYYNNILSNEHLTCNNQVGRHHLLDKKQTFELEMNDFITSFIVVYGDDDVMRNVKITTKKGKKFTIPYHSKVERSRSISEREIIPEGKNVLVTLFYGVGGHIHNVGCYYLEEKFYKKIQTISKLKNFHYLKNKYNKKSLEEILVDIQQKNNNRIDGQKIEIDDGIIKFFFITNSIIHLFIIN